ncbi:MAG: sulfatase-like hydrolase/transferase [Prevotella sp.]|nr:sulfatase-like hydrolase/transferase [Prevotella sp.]
MNLLFVHHYFLQTIGLEVGCFKSSVVDNLIASLLDVTVIFLVSWLITLRRVRASLAITFVITLIWSFVNAFYARFFHQYLNWSSMGQAGNLSDTSVINSMLAEFHAIDLFYLVMAIFFFWLFIRSRKNNITSKSLKTIVLAWLICAALGVFAHALYVFHPHYGVVYALEKTMFTPEKMDAMWPNWTVFHKGFFRKLVVDQLTRKKEIKLTKEQIEEIEKAYSDHSLRVTGRTAPDSIRNIIFILVESYLSVTSDLVVDGKEITPNMNKLKHDSTVYYNGHMRPNVSIGESADGQFIYMAGLLPLHSEITVSKAKRDTIIGLPEQMKKVSPDLKSYTLIPTNPTLWEQQPMTEAYGFESLYSMIDYQAEVDPENDGFLTDGMIFNYASSKDDTTPQPFFSLILTMSMHQPYESFEKHGFEVTNKNLPQRYKNYLNSCHYFDMQIGKYLEDLKAKGLYDKSLIIIVADHDARARYLDMEGKISDDIPIYIINGGFNPADAWQGGCNQLDVYTTIMDIMGIDSKWRGLGHTLLNKDYQNSVTTETQELSDLIIYSNYFGTKDNK